MGQVRMLAKKIRAAKTNAVRDPHSFFANEPDD